MGAIGFRKPSPVTVLARRHRQQEFLRLVKLIDSAVPEDLDLHLGLDNYATHKTPVVRQWLLKHPRFHLHFSPASSSWLNLVGRCVRRAHQPQAPPLGSPQRHRYNDRGEVLTASGSGGSTSYGYNGDGAGQRRQAARAVVGGLQ